MRMLIVAAAVLAAACSQPAQETTTEPQAAADLLTEVQALGPEMQLVRGLQDLQAYQAAHPEVQPTCASVRATESRGVIPSEGVPETSIYSSLAGALVISVQCGPQLTQTRMDPREHWLVVYAPGATEVNVVNCGLADGRDACPRQVVPAAPAATTPPAN